MTRQDATASELRSLARGALAQEDLETAGHILQRVVQLEPRSPADLRDLASICLRLNAADEAVKHLKRALALQPRDAACRQQYAVALAQNGAFAQAIVQHRKAIADGAPNPEGSWVEIATLQERVRQPRLARDAAHKALECRPNYPPALNTLGNLASREGEFEEAERWYRQALEHTREPTEKAKFQHAIGALMEKCKRWDEAFLAHQQANHILSRSAMARDAMRRSLPESQWEYVAEGVEDLYRRWADREFHDNLPTPLFLVGFPRSGTTMTEQALAALPNVRTTDEHPFMSTVTERAWAMIDRMEEPPGGFVPGLDRLTDAQLTELRMLYWSEVWRVVGTKARDEGLRVLDKHPLRILDVGLINRLFPRAKIITMLRDPRDCCLSAFFQDLGITPVSARFLTLETLGDVYATIMGFWVDVRDRLAIDWTEVRYEDLVVDFEPGIRRIVDFIGEPWDDRVLQFHEKAARRTISTPSYEAVTQKVNTRAVGKWANYEKHIGPLVQRIRPFLETFGYEE